MTPALAIRALRARGLHTGLVRRPLNEIFSYLMPVILLDKDGGACILLRRLTLDTIGGDMRYEVLLPEAGNGSTVLTGPEINDRYSGHCLLIKPEPKPDLRAGDPLPVPDSHWLWSTLWKYKRHYLSTILSALMINVLALAITFFTMNVYDRVVPNQAFTTLWSLGAGVVLAMLFEFISRNVRTYVIDVAGKKADLVLGSLLFRQAMSMRLESRPANTGSFAYQLREFESVREFATSATLAALTDLPFVFLFLWVTHMVAGQLAWVVLWAAALVVLVSIAIQWPLARVMRENLKESAQKQGVVIEAVEGVEALKAATAEGFMQHKWEQYSALAASSTMKSRLLSGLATNTTILITQLCTVVMIVWGVYLISDGHLSLGGLIGAIILSGRALAPLNLVQLVGDALRSSGLPPNLLELEVTESAVMQDVRQAAEKMASLRQMGVKLAIDDFGTGYSNLNSLRNFPVSRLKIDKSFMRDIPVREGGFEITTAVIALGHKFNLRVLAEGVETQEQLEFLRQQGCDELQGYFISRPLDAENLERWINSQGGLRNAQQRLCV